MKFGNILRSQPQPQRRPSQEKCRIKVKKHADGSYTKEISGHCSKEQLQALTNVDGRDDNINVE